MAATLQVALGAISNIATRVGDDEMKKNAPYAKEARESQNYWNGTVLDQSKTICFSTKYSSDALSAGSFATRCLQQGYKTYQFNDTDKSTTSKPTGGTIIGSFSRHGFQLQKCPAWFKEWAGHADKCLNGGRHYLVVFGTRDYMGAIGNGLQQEIYNDGTTKINACYAEFEYAKALQNKGGNVKFFSSVEQAHAFMSEMPSAGELATDGLAAVGGAIMAPANFLGNVGKSLFG